MLQNPDKIRNFNFNWFKINKWMNHKILIYPELFAPSVWRVINSISRIIGTKLKLRLIWGELVKKQNSVLAKKHQRNGKKEGKRGAEKTIKSENEKNRERTIDSQSGLKYYRTG